MSNITEMFQSRPKLHDLLQPLWFRTHLLKIHDRHFADLHVGVIQLGDHELQSPVDQLWCFVEESTELMCCKQAGFLLSARMFLAVLERDSSNSDTPYNSK